MSMSEWKVSSNPVAGKIFYQVFRIRDTSKIDHSGNRETRGLYETREEAEKVAANLNSMLQKKEQEERYGNHGCL